MRRGDENMKKYVIIGNGTAAIGCIEGIRSVDGDGTITVISAEKHHVYCRPLISYYLEGKTDTEKMKYRPDDFYAKNGCNVLYGRSAVSIDKDSETVTLDSGEKIPYDALCIACGSSPFVPPFKGLDTVENKFSFMTLDDALAIEKKLSSESRVLIAGAGLIGLKCAEGLYGRAAKITVFDLADRVLSSILDDESAAAVQKHLEDKGISFMLGDTAESFDGNTASMRSGKTEKFDILILAVGVKANVSLISEAGGKCEKGIETDTHMHTSLKNVYAAGDCVQSVDITDGRAKVLAIMPNAYMQGNCAGQNMAGADKEFNNAVAMNSIGFFGLHVMTAGTYQDEKAGGTEYRIENENGFKKLFCKDDCLKGFIIVGDVDKAGIYTDLIRKQIPLSSVKFEDLKKKADLRAFDKNYRRKKLGGVV